MARDYVNRLKGSISLDKDNGWIFGVCAGIANYCRLDPAIVRVGVLVTGLFLPKIVMATYLITWLILDDRSLLYRNQERSSDRKTETRERWRDY